MKIPRTELDPDEDEEDEVDYEDEADEAERERRRARNRAEGINYQFKSKADKLIDVVSRIIASERNPKILVFSSFQNTLAHVKVVMEAEDYK